MINRALWDIILNGRERRSKNSDCCEDIVKAARNRPEHLYYPGDMDAPEPNKYNQSDYKD